MRILIVGATGGIGQALARELKDHELFLCGRNKSALRALAEATDGHALPAALEDELEVEALLKEIGPLDLLLYAAGAVSKGPLREIDRDDVERLLVANTLGALFTLKHAHFERGARAAFLGAYPSYVEVPGFSLYAASKRALEGLLNAARKEFAKEQIFLTLVRLPAVATGLWTPLGGAPRGAKSPKEVAKAILTGLEAEPPPPLLEL
jgi:cyclic-di-GMP-binding biofilm dispersal mediator protein